MDAVLQAYSENFTQLAAGALMLFVCSLVGGAICLLDSKKNWPLIGMFCSLFILSGVFVKFAPRPELGYETAPVVQPAAYPPPTANTSCVDAYGWNHCKNL